jgi:hypothetical protein
MIPTYRALYRGTRPRASRPPERRGARHIAEPDTISLLSTRRATSIACSGPSPDPQAHFDRSTKPVFPTDYREPNHLVCALKARRMAS